MRRQLLVVLFNFWITNKIYLYLGNTSDGARRPAQEELDQILQEVGISPQAQLLDRSITPEVPGSVQHRVRSSFVKYHIF
jgi:hypothetical protein